MTRIMSIMTGVLNNGSRFCMQEHMCEHDYTGWDSVQRKVKLKINLKGHSLTTKLMKKVSLQDTTKHCQSKQTIQICMN